MKKRAGILVFVLTALLCAHALGSGTVYETLGECRIETLTEGFAVPVPADTERFRSERTSDHYLSCRSTDRSAPNSLYLDAYVFDPLDEFAEQRERAKAVYDAQHYEKNEEYQEENLLLHKHDARICVFRGKADSGDYSVGIIRYVRNNRMLQIRLYSEPQNGTAWEDLPRITMADMRKLAEQVDYDPEKASVTEKDGAFTLQAKDGKEYLTAGQTLRITASFLRPEIISKSSWNNAFRWSVRDDGTGEKPKGISIDKNGVLTADRQIANTMNVTVSAESQVFHTTAEIPMLIVPAARKLSVEPAKLTVYTGMKEPVTVRAVPEPNTVPPVGMTWSAIKEGIVEITPDTESGTAGIRPLKAGQTLVTVKEPGGSSAKLTVTVVKAVEDIQLSVSGNPIPYGVVNVKEKLIPQDAGNRNVIWSLDVGPEIATIRRGKVTIGSRAPAGTVITVTCTAVGAPEPVVATVQIEVKKR